MGISWPICFALSEQTDTRFVYAIASNHSTNTVPGITWAIKYFSFFSNFTIIFKKINDIAYY